MSPLVISKTVFFQVLVMLAFAGYAALSFFHKECRPRVTRLFAGVWILVAVIALSGIFGLNGARSIWSVPQRMTGIVLMVHLAAYFTMLSGMSRSFSWKRYLHVSLGISVVVALFPLVQTAFPAIFFDRLGDRLSGTVGNPIFLASYLFFHVFIALRYAEETYRARGAWWPYALAAALNLVVIVLTQTRAALVAGAVSLFILSLYAFSGFGSRKSRNAVYMAWLFAILFAGTFWATRESALWHGVPILGRIAQEGVRSDDRLFAWKAGLQAFAEKPLTGVGWENFYTAFNAHYDPRLLRNGFSETFFDRPHNVFIQFLAETGIIGFAAYVFLLACAFYAARKDKWIVALLAAYVTQNFFAFDSISSYVMFFAVLAWIGARETPAYGAVAAEGGAGSVSRGLPVFLGSLLVAGIGIYFFDYRVYAASRLEWESVNYFVHAEVPEGLDYMDQALAAPTPYHAYIGKDLYPNISLFYKQGLPLPDVRNLVENAVRGMEGIAEGDPLNYGFWIGFADMMPAIVPLDAKYADEGLAALKKAEALSPRRQATLYVRAKLLNLKGDKAGALKAMADAVALDPEVGDAHFFYALLLLESGDREGGVRELAAAAALGRDPRTIDEATVAAGQLGDLGAYKESIEYFKKALVFEPDNAEANMKLGLVYYFSGDKDSARAIIGGPVLKKQDLTKSPQYPQLIPILRDLGLLK